MAALVQTYPQQASGVTMLQTRTSPSTSFAPDPSSRGSQVSRFSPSSSGSYRGLPAAGFVNPYNFSSTPYLANNTAGLLSPAQPHLRPQNRTLSAPTVFNANQQPMSLQTALSTRHGLANPPPLVSSPSSSTSLPSNKNSFDDASVATRDTSIDIPARPKSTIGLSPSYLSQFSDSLASPKPSPDRYRRTARSTAGDLSVAAASNRSAADQPFHDSALPRHERSHDIGQSSLDDMSVGKQRSKPEVAQRYRRRSLGSVDAIGTMSSTPSLTHTQPQPPLASEAAGNLPLSRFSAGESGLVDFSQWSSSTTLKSVRNDTGPTEGGTENGTMHVSSVSKQDVKLVNLPPRSNVTRRSKMTSPLSNASPKPNDSPDPSGSLPAPASRNDGKPAPVASESPAVQQLNAIHKDSKKSKLRRAFSFGSAAELRRATAQNTLERNAQAAKITKRNSKFEDEMDPEQAKIAQKQEAAGLGESIYSGQGNFFTGSTDNLSVQSSASSASVMLRKMGKGVKRSTRSVVGLFRPKSVVGVPAADGPVASSAQVTPVTVEAEREKVNVNPNPHDQVGGGTGFPKLERNSLDANASVEHGRPALEDLCRRSVVGGEHDRAEVLAAVKKGILKRTDSSLSSPAPTPTAAQAPDFHLPAIPHISASPQSSAPSTPSEAAPPRSGHRRTDSLTLDSSEHDYFSSITQYATLNTTSILPTSAGSLSRNISFSPRIQFHDTWPSMEYDRRGDIATCNRLTPMLAQQIKEELNTFKMEMEVHESSKVYTHFF